MRAALKSVLISVAALSLAPQLEAQAPTGYQFFSVPPCRLFDSRATTPPSPLVGGTARMLTPAGQCGVPSGAVAVSMNITVVSPTNAGFLALRPGDYTATEGWSNLNFPAGATIANHAIQMLASDGSGTFSITPRIGPTNSTHVIVDVDGYFSVDLSAVAPAEGPFEYHPIFPCRNLDTRFLAPPAPLQPGERRPIRIGGTCGVPNEAPVGVVYATVVGPNVAGHAYIYPGSYLNPPASSTLNFTAEHGATGNGAIVRLDSSPQDMKAVIAFASANLTVDSYGYFDYGAAADFIPLSGCRALDTRVTGGSIPAGTARTLDLRAPGSPCVLPAEATAVVANVTVVSPTSTGHLRVYANNTPDPGASALNFTLGDTALANELIFPVRDVMGQPQALSIKPGMTGPGNHVDVIVDVFGYFVGPLVGLGGISIPSPTAPAVSSADYRSVDRGFFPDQVYHVSDLDNVNLFNGNLNINLPIGPRYPVGGGLSYGLNLSYNSNIRDLKTYEDPNSDGQFITLAVPSETSNAGVGWTLGMGSFRKPPDSDSGAYEYTSPDGAVHKFYPLLNAYEQSHAATPQAGYLYTRDGSYLRLSFPGSGAMVETPDGTKLLFQGGPYDWDLRQISNRFATDVIDVTTNRTGSALQSWVISDPHRQGPTITVHFIADPSPAQVYAKGLVDSIELISFGGAHSHYQFYYQSAPMAYGCQDTYPNTHKPDSVRGVPFLTQVQAVEDGSAYTFQYYSNAGIPGTTCSANLLQSATYPTGGSVAWTYEDRSFNASFCRKQSGGFSISASVASRTVSANGSAPATWYYHGYRSVPPQIPQIECSNQNETHPPVSEELRVEVLGPPRGPATGGPRITKTENYFSIWPRTNQPVAGTAFDSMEYSLPFTRAQNDGDQPARFLSTQTFDCDAASTHLDPNDGLFHNDVCYSPGSTTAGPAAAPVRSTYVRYEHDVPSIPDWSMSQEGIYLQRRVASERTVFYDDVYSGGNPRFTIVDRSDFDGLGHYRTTTSRSNFFNTSTEDPNETTTIAFNQGVQPSYNSGSYPANPTSGTSFTMYPAGRPWLVNLFSDRMVQNATTVRELYCFDPDTGFLNAKRTLFAPSVASQPQLTDKDVFVSYLAAANLPDAHPADTPGNIESERYFGSDDRGTSMVGACALPAVPPKYRIDHTYQFGSMASSRYYKSDSTPMPFKVLDLDIDQATGLPARSRDTAGVCTSFAYDSMNRLTWVKPGDASGASNCTLVPGQVSQRYGAWVQRTYTAGSTACNPASNSGACASARAIAYLSETSGGTPLADSQIVFDGLGRVASERQRLPDTTQNERVTRYNPDGSKAFVSEVALQGQASGIGTSFNDYDPFGRPGTVTGPDGQTIDFTYAGARVKNRSVKVLTDQGLKTSETSEFYNHLGRLRRVSEPFDLLNGLPNATTNYDYDALGNLTKVTMLNTSGSQVRNFFFDGLGHLTGENHPEKDTPTSGGPDVQYSGYDARGHFRTKQDGDVTTLYDYDSAERVTQISLPGSPNKIPLKTFTYDTASGCCGLGKLASSSRYNDLILSNLGTRFQIIEDYVYGARAGSVSQRTVSLRQDGAVRPEQFDQTFTYNDLGELTQQKYPQCTFTNCTAANAPARTQFYSYLKGLLTGLTGPAGMGGNAQITYYPNLAVQRVQFTGQESWNQEIQNNMVRPSRIFIAKGGAEMGSIGPYSYDAAGNITAIGGQSYTYDVLSRVTSAVLDSTHSQTYLYDGFGNMSAVGGTNGRAIPVSSATNRLTGSAVGASCTGAQVDAVSYDKAGNLTCWHNQAYEYDSFNQMKHFRTSSVDSWYVYDADDERVLTLTLAGGARSKDRWTLRGLGNEVLRTYDATYSAATGLSSGFLFKDYIYRGSALLASYSPSDAPNAERHFQLNHLGTPTAIWNGSGGSLGPHFYYPYGEDAYATDNLTDSEVMKFTGHERDLNALGSTADDLDYMHAREFGQLTGRFSSPDRHLGQPRMPKSWNRYAYVQGNPLRYVDPNGKDTTGTYAGGESFTSWNDPVWASVFGGAVTVGGVALAVEGGEAALADLAFRVTASRAAGQVLTRFAPVASSPALQKVVNQLYKSSDRWAGGTAGALRIEAETGVMLSRSSTGHLQAGLERLGNIGSVLETGGLDSGDVEIAMKLQFDLKSALEVFLGRLGYTSQQAAQIIAGGKVPLAQ